MRPDGTPRGAKKPFIILGVVVIGLVLLVVGWRALTGNNNTGDDGSRRDTPGKSAKAEDTSPPALKIIDGDAIDGQVLSGTVTVAIEATDDVAVDRVEYYIDGNLLSVTYAAPFHLALDTAALTPGSHTLLIRAYDAAGNVTKSQTLTFTVAESDTAPAASTTTTRRTASHTTGTSSGGTSGSGAATDDDDDDTPAPAPDTQAPTAPSSLMLAADGPYVVQVSWTASTDNVGVTQYKVYRGGAVLGTSTTASYTDYTVVPGNEYEYSVEAVDAASNATGSATEPTITLAPTSIWMPFDVPAATATNGGSGLELGVKFSPLVDGQITGIRFYKSVANTGTHTGTLWTSGGSSLATVTFSGETASGWQQATFSTPVDVTAGTTYVASYFNPTGNFSRTFDYFENAGITSQFLSAPRSSDVAGGNGVFRNATTGFPTSTFQETNYWVDVTFVPDADVCTIDPNDCPAATLADSDEIFDGYPGSDNTGVVGKRLPNRDRGPDIVTPGMTIENVAFNVAQIIIDEDNTTFRNVKINYTGGFDVGFALVSLQSTPDGTVFEDCEVDGNDAIERGISGNAGATVTRCNIHNTGNGVELADKFTVQDSYLHDIVTADGTIWHADGVSSAGSGSNITVDHNTIFLPGDETGAVNITGGGTDAFTNVLIQDNLLAGGGYTVLAGANTDTNYQIINNKFSTRFYPKVGNINIYHPDWLAGVTISGNTIYETGAAANANLP